MISNRADYIKSQLTRVLGARLVEVIDESHKHAGHAGARGGGGHFNVLIVAECFAGKSLLERHRLVYNALHEAMQTEIHALSITAKSTSEV